MENPVKAIITILLKHSQGCYQTSKTSNDLEFERVTLKTSNFAWFLGKWPWMTSKNIFSHIRNGSIQLQRAIPNLHFFKVFIYGVCDCSLVDLDTAILDHYSALLVVVQIQTCFGI